MKTFSAKPAEVTHEWFVIDATDKVLGRVASEVALRLRGKHKAIYTPHVDTGDFIVVINASKLRVTGAKELDKMYYRHSGYPGGIYQTNFRDMQAKHPGRFNVWRDIDSFAAVHAETAELIKFLGLEGIEDIEGGDLSYGVYIYGWPSEQLVMWLSGGRAVWWQVFFGSLTLALPMAWLSWHGVEKWALRWGRTVGRQPLTVAPASADG